MNKFSITNRDPITIYIPNGLELYLKLAVNDLQNDIEKIVGIKPSIVDFPQDDNCIILNEVGEGWESYSIKSTPQNCLEINGSNSRSIMFGIYTFMEDFLGINPFYWWSGIFPKKSTCLYWENIDYELHKPSFKFRGWFINDEDLLCGLKCDGAGYRDIDYPYYDRVIHKDIIQKIAESAVRARFNLIIPESFVDIYNPDEKMLLDECAARGLFLSMHHVEPLGVSAFSFSNYWKRQGKEYKYSYFSEPNAICQVWQDYANAWAQYPNVIWQIGLRGIADTPFWFGDDSVANSDIVRGELISKALAKQVDIITKALGKKPQYLTMTLWAEGSALNQKKLIKFPENTIKVFSDNCAGWRMQQDCQDAIIHQDQKYGIYYHIAIMSGTHLAQAIPPIATWQVLMEQYKRGINEYIIFNTSNIREFIYCIAGSSKITNDIESFDANKFLKSWILTHFSDYHKNIEQAYELFFNAYELHPETGVALFNDGLIFLPMTKYITALTKDKIDDEVHLFHENQMFHELSQHIYDENELLSLNNQNETFINSLRDMYSILKSPRRNIQLLAAQEKGFELVLAVLGDIMEKLPSKEADFLFDQLIYQAKFMILIAKICNNMAISYEAFKWGNKQKQWDYAQTSLLLFDELFELMPQYCHGKWTFWYNGWRKNKWSNMHNLLRETMKINL